LNTGSFYIEDIKKYLDKEKRIFSWYDLLSKKKGKN
jgi:hypothetical protein